MKAPFYIISDNHFMMKDDNNSIKIKNKIAEELFFRLNGWRLTDIKI